METLLMSGKERMRLEVMGRANRGEIAPVKAQDVKGAGSLRVWHRATISK